MRIKKSKDILRIVCGIVIFMGVSAASSVFAMIDATTDIGAGAATVNFTHAYGNVVHIPGGTVSAPYEITGANTEYILDADMVAPATAIVIKASNVILNLNGRSITYNTASPGNGVMVDYNRSGVKIYNGAIEQGSARSTGDVYGRGSNPIRIYGDSLNIEIAGITATWYSQDTNGIHGGGPNAEIHHNALNDNYVIGVLANRMQGNSAIRPASAGVGVVAGNKVHHNKVSCRHRCIDAMNGDEVYNNEITIRSIATNSYGVFAFNATGVSVHHNKIFGTGEHPIGIIAAHNDTMPNGGYDIFTNYIEVQTTKLGTEYVAAGGNYAVGFRTTWGGNNIDFYDNNIMVRTDSAYAGTYSDTGQPLVLNGKGRGLMIQARPGQKQVYRDNTITVLDKDGTGNAFGVALNGEASAELNDGSGIVIKNNTIVSNVHNIVLGDEYGPARGHPLFMQNTLIRSGEYGAYRTVASKLNGYNVGTGRFIGNVYQAGASKDSIDMNFQASTNKSVIFGRLMEGTVRNSLNVPVSGMVVTVRNRNGDTENVGITNAEGKIQFMVYDYELNNANGSTGSATPVRIDFRPHTIELATLFTTAPEDAVSAWDAPTSSGVHMVSGANGSIEINTEARGYVAPSVDATPPATPTGLSVQ